MYILHIETATSVCSVALSQDGRLLAFREQHEPNIHATKLTVFIEELLEEAHLSMANLDAVAVSKGPGSYTGLRIGVSVAKGLCYALDIPLVAVNTLDALTAGFLAEKRTGGLSTETLLSPMLDARRMEVYTALYDAQGNQLEPTSARIIDVHSFDSLLEKGKKLVLFGDGADKLLELFAEHEAIEVVSGFKNAARYMVSPAVSCLNRQQVENVAYFEPFYLKDFIPTTPKRAF